MSSKLPYSGMPQWGTQLNNYLKSLEQKVSDLETFISFYTTREIDYSSELSNGFVKNSLKFYDQDDNEILDSKTDTSTIDSFYITGRLYYDGTMFDIKKDTEGNSFNLTEEGIGNEVFDITGYYPIYLKITRNLSNDLDFKIETLRAQTNYEGQFTFDRNYILLGILVNLTEKYFMIKPQTSNSTIKQRQEDAKLAAIDKFIIEANGEIGNIKAFSPATKINYQFISSGLNYIEWSTSYGELFTTCDSKIDFINMVDTNSFNYIIVDGDEISSVRKNTFEILNPTSQGKAVYRMLLTNSGDIVIQKKAERVNNPSFSSLYGEHFPNIVDYLQASEMVELCRFFKNNTTTNDVIVYWSYSNGIPTVLRGNFVENVSTNVQGEQLNLFMNEDLQGPNVSLIPKSYENSFDYKQKFLMDMNDFTELMLAYNTVGSENFFTTYSDTSNLRPGMTLYCHNLPHPLYIMAVLDPYNIQVNYTFAAGELTEGQAVYVYNDSKTLLTDKMLGNSFSRLSVDWNMKDIDVVSDTIDIESDTIDIESNTINIIQSDANKMLSIKAQAGVIISPDFKIKTSDALGAKSSLSIDEYGKTLINRNFEVDVTSTEMESFGDTNITAGAISVTTKQNTTNPALETTTTGKFVLESEGDISLLSNEEIYCRAPSLYLEGSSSTIEISDTEIAIDGPAIDMKSTSNTGVINIKSGKDLIVKATNTASTAVLDVAANLLKMDVGLNFKKIPLNQTLNVCTINLGDSSNVSNNAIYLFRICYELNGDSFETTFLGRWGKAIRYVAEFGSEGQGRNIFGPDPYIKWVSGTQIMFLGGGGLSYSNVTLHVAKLGEIVESDFDE